MDSTDALALAALVVALAALLNTISQVLQQYFATADGYRRCSSSVMGDWARFTKRKFKWRELRFETIFVTPVIFLDVAYDLNLAQSQDSTSVVMLDGSEEMSKWPGLKKVGLHERRWIHGRHHRWMDGGSVDLEKPRIERRRTPSTPSSTGIKRFLRRNTPLLSPESPLEKFLALDTDPNGKRLDNEPVTWIPLMQSLQNYSGALIAGGLSVFQDVGSGSLLRGRILTPAVRISRKSWDFMPPEITKPLALSNLRDVVTICQYIGARWTNFKPEEGILRAEGDGVLVTSAEVRSLGTVISITKTDNRVEMRRELHGVIFSPFEGAVNLGFGIIHSDLLGGESYRIYSQEDCHDTLDYLSSSVRDYTGLPKPVLQSAITDILGILSPVLRPVQTGITYIVKPSEFVSDNIQTTRGPVEVFLGATVISSRGSLAEFLGELGLLLQSHCNLPDSQESKHPRLISIYESGLRFVGNKKWRKSFGRPITAFHGYANQVVINLLEELHQAWDEATSFLSAHQTTCRAVLGIHLAALLSCWQDVLMIQRELPLRYLENAATAQRQLMKLYFTVCRQKCMDTLNTQDPSLIEEVWVTIILRSVLWHAIHNFDDRVVAVPPRYFDSNLPIYIS